MSINLGYRNGETRSALVPTKPRRTYQQMSLAVEGDSWLCNFIFSKILIASVFEKQTKRRLGLKNEFKIEFLLPFTVKRKVLEKMPGVGEEGKFPQAFCRNDVRSNTQCH